MAGGVLNVGLIPGHALSKIWTTLSQTQKDEVIKKLAEFNVTLIKASSFKKIGSIFAIDGAFSVGPLVPSCFPWFFRKDPSLDSGPWASEREYLLACVTRELIWISNHPEELAARWAPGATGQAEKDAVVKGYTTLLQRLQAEIPKLEALDNSFGELNSFVLRHPDLSSDNIILREDDPTVIAGIIDWECSFAAPIWVVTTVPEFIRDFGDAWEGDPSIPASSTRLREIYVKTCSDALPIGFEEARKVAKKLCVLEQVVRIVTTMCPVETIEENIKFIFDET
ncbi:hypothetical protein HGRIS_000603 [Hohenbuehelia grisea]|uniref:Aminoglycoside phosphotransferase domain-containing protein n=1 Tax=Hohenbuehelia grisea TaxID=104357 RepID=A0ABR3JSF6_9AGAR